VRRFLSVATLCALATSLAGCGATQQVGGPQVTFTAAGIVAAAKPAQYCDDKVTQCAQDPAAVVRLRVPAGTPVRVEVPAEVASAPWHVVFSYRRPSGEQVEGRSELFRPDRQRDYTLVLPEPADVLSTAQVQQFGIRPIADERGAVSFPIRASWVLESV
jgi:Protein of unknown function (DUF2771)